MKTLIIYDSAYGNTEKIAGSMAEAIRGDVKVLNINSVNASEFESLDFLFLGCPTYGGRPTPAMLDFLKTLSPNSIKGLNSAVFDTRMAGRMVKIFGFAAGKLASDLNSKGAQVLGSEGFLVKSKEGPLIEGELERAADWAKEIVNTQHQVK
jgi:flavodoxin I